jgi:hypothetical protein
VVALLAKKLLVCLTLFLALPLAVLAAGPGGDDPGSESRVPVEEWVGRVFIVLPLEQSKKADGYAMTFQAPRPELQTAGGNIRAEWLEGKQLQVTAVKRLPASGQGLPADDYEVALQVADDGTVVAAKALGGQLAQVVLVDDLAAAKKRFVGKTVYSKRLAIPAYQETLATIRVKISEPLTVEDVIAGISADEPIWLVVSTADKRRGYIAIAYSQTNMHPGVWPTARPWETVLFEDDPRTVYAWDDQVWEAINDGVARQGMTPDQVRLAWGEPRSIVKTEGDETWYYPDKLVKFHPTAGLYLIQTR